MNAFEIEHATNNGDAVTMAVIAVEELVVYRYHVPLTDGPEDAEAVALERFRDGELADAGPTEGEQHDLSAHYAGLLKGQNLSYEDWLSLYRPRPNDIVSHAPFDGLMFETFGAEMEHVAASPANCIWTMVDVDGKTFITNGLRIVDRLGYFVTEVPWGADEIVELVID